MRPQAPVLVVGAGIAGLAAALALARRGFEVRLCEQAERLEEVGAGIQLSPNALRVLNRLAILPALRRSGVEATQVSLRDLRDGRVLARVPVRGDDGTPYLSIRRAALQSALVEAVRNEPSVRLDLGTELVGLEKQETMAIASLGSPSGEEVVVAPVLIAADGVRSRVGECLGAAAARASGDIAWRATVENAGQPIDGIEAWLGPACHAVAYPVDGGRAINVVVVLAERRGDPRNALRKADARLRQLVESGAPPMPWPLAVADRRRQADDPPGVLLIGDAAHAMLPYAAQGAALAIEDAFVAAFHLREAEDAVTAWRRFEAERRPRWDRVRRRVGFHRLIYHLPRPFDFGRNIAMRMRSDASLAADLTWLYDWRPPKL